MFLAYPTTGGSDKSTFHKIILSNQIATLANNLTKVAIYLNIYLNLVAYD